MFICRLDDTSKGLQGTIERYRLLMEAEDPILHHEMQSQVGGVLVRLSMFVLFLYLSIHCLTGHSHKFRDLTQHSTRYDG